MTDLITAGGDPAPPRPKTLTGDMRRAVVMALSGELKTWNRGAPVPERQLAALERAIGGRSDGYRLASAIDGRDGWKADEDLVEILSSASHLVRQQIEQAQAEWIAVHGIRPPLPDGTRVCTAHVTGVIAGVCPHTPGAYRVRAGRDPRPDRYWIVNWEDAVALPGAASAAGTDRTAGETP